MNAYYSGIDLHSDNNVTFQNRLPVTQVVESEAMT